MPLCTTRVCLLSTHCGRGAMCRCADKTFPVFCRCKTQVDGAQHSSLSLKRCTIYVSLAHHHHYTHINFLVIYTQHKYSGPPPLSKIMSCLLSRSAFCICFRPGTEHTGSRIFMQEAHKSSLSSQFQSSYHVASGELCTPLIPSNAQRVPTECFLPSVRRVPAECLPSAR